METLFVNNNYNLFAKADCGASQRSMGMIRALANLGHVDVISFVDETVSNVPNVDVLFSGFIDMAEYQESRFAKFKKMFCRRDPYAIYPENRRKSGIIDGIIAKKKYDYVVVRYLYYACDCGLLKYADRLVLDIDDDPKEVVLMSLDKIKSWRNKQYHRIYADTVKKVTNNTVKRVYKAFYSSPGKTYPNAVFLPNISLWSESVSNVKISKKPNKLLVVGWYRYYPNIEGLKHFIINVFPIIRKQVQDAELDVVGKMDDEDLRLLCKSTVGVNLKGFVEDLKGAYDDCKCVVVPIYKGTGTSVKLVEALACGRAVVTTPVGKRGLCPAFQEGVDYLPANSDEEFAQNVTRLLTNVELNEMMCESALKKVQLYYSEEAFNEIVSLTLCSMS